MRASLPTRLVSALVVPALVASGAAQGMLLMRCGRVEARSSCCCPKSEVPAPSTTIAAGERQCCDAVAVPGLESATHERFVASPTAPALAAVAPASARELFVESPQRIPRLDPPPGPSPVLANCALLI
jgi:hypothetical protein